MMTKRKKRQRNMDPDLEKWIKRRARRGEQPIDIYREMQKSEEWKHLENLPILRTVQNVVKDQKIQDKTAPWSVADEEFTAEEARLILDVLADVIVTLGETRVFTKTEAEWVLKVRKLAPELFMDEVWELARAYMLAESKGDTQALDAFLAFMPWKTKNRRDNYETAMDNDWIEEPDFATVLWSEGVVPMRYVNLAPSGLTKMRAQRKSGNQDEGFGITKEEAADWIKTEQEGK